MQDGNGELEKLTQERGDSDEIKTVKARLISATGTGPYQWDIWFWRVKGSAIPDVSKNGIWYLQ